MVDHPGHHHHFPSLLGLWRLLPTARKRLEWTLGAASLRPKADQKKPTQGISCGPCAPLGVFLAGQAWQGRDSLRSARVQNGRGVLASWRPANGEGHGASRILPDQKVSVPVLFFPKPKIFSHPINSDINKP